MKNQFFLSNWGKKTDLFPPFSTIFAAFSVFFANFGDFSADFDESRRIFASKEPKN
jgi:hypothetical protein